MPTTGVAQWTCAVSNLGFIYIYGYKQGDDHQTFHLASYDILYKWVKFKNMPC